MQEYPHGKKLEGRVNNDEHKDERELLKDKIKDLKDNGYELTI